MVEKTVTRARCWRKHVHFFICSRSVITIVYFLLQRIAWDICNFAHLTYIGYQSYIIFVWISNLNINKKSIRQKYNWLKQIKKKWVFPPYLKSSRQLECRTLIFSERVKWPYVQDRRLTHVSKSNCVGLFFGDESIVTQSGPTLLRTTCI